MESRYFDEFLCEDREKKASLELRNRDPVVRSIRPTEQPRLSPEGNVSQSSFGGIVGETPTPSPQGSV
jgi:hypothetical protein